MESNLSFEDILPQEWVNKHYNPSWTYISRSWAECPALNWFMAFYHEYEFDSTLEQPSIQYRVVDTNREVVQALVEVGLIEIVVDPTIESNFFRITPKGFEFLRQYSLLQNI